MWQNLSSLLFRILCFVTFLSHAVYSVVYCSYSHILYCAQCTIYMYTAAVVRVVTQPTSLWLPLFSCPPHSSCGRAIKEQCKTPVSPVAWLLKQYSAPLRKTQQMEGKKVKRWRPSGVIILKRLENPYSKTQAATCSGKESEKEIENENESRDEREIERLKNIKGSFLKIAEQTPRCLMHTQR